jgi:hypothetical protein
MGKIIDTLHLYEKQISNVKDVTVKINLKNLSVQDTKHVQDREKQRDITEDEIIKTIKKAIPTIVNDLANGDIERNSDILIHNKESKLNVIAALKFQKGIDFITAVTVMRKAGFKPKAGTVKYDV